MGKRGITVWIFSSLTFFAAIHVLEAISALFFNNEIVLLKLYPLLNTLNIGVIPYFVASTAVTIPCGG